MNRTRQFVLAVMTAALLTGCTQAPVQTDPAQGAGPAEPAVPAEQAPAADADRGGQAQTGQNGAVSREAALAVALENAGVPAADAYNIRTERDEESGIPVYDIEFETDYGDYDFQVARSDGQIVGADYEVDEEWLDTLGGRPSPQKRPETWSWRRSREPRKRMSGSGKNRRTAAAGMKARLFPAD